VCFRSRSAASGSTHHLQGLQWTAVALVLIATAAGTLATSRWRERNAKVFIDGDTLVALLGFTVHYFSNLLGLMVLCYSVYWVMAYTGQSVVLPVPGQREYLVYFLPVACWFKLLDLAFLVYQQCSQDIFLVDWERVKSEPQADSTSTDTTTNVRYDGTKLLQHSQPDDPSWAVCGGASTSLPSCFTCRLTVTRCLSSACWWWFSSCMERTWHSTTRMTQTQPTRSGMNAFLSGQGIY